jgi:octopine/nopaline transport system permease protein
MDIAFLLETMTKLFAVLPLTLLLWALSVSLGGALALGLVWMRVSGLPALEGFARAYIFVFRGSPLLVQMFLIYYGLGQFAFVRDSLFWPILREPFACAVISLALCTAGYTAEIFRGGLIAVPAQQMEAARACGMSGWLMLRRIVAPIALRAALPAYSTELVLMMKSTSLASLVTVWEVTGVSQRIIHSTYRTFEVFFCAALIYLVLNFLIVRALGYLEYRLSAHRRARPEPRQPRQAVVA